VSDDNLAPQLLAAIEETERIARQDPKATLIRCKEDRKLIAEVQSWTHFECEDSWYACSRAIRPKSQDRCECGTDQRRDAVLRSLARVYNITAEEGNRG
jgi:hypothetical protein